jgi:hypothetical protein
MFFVLLFALIDAKWLVFGVNGAEIFLNGMITVHRKPKDILETPLDFN